MEIKFERATIDDAEILANVRNQSFYSDYIKYGECPGYNVTKNHMIESILSRISYKIICNDEVVGNISIKDNHDGTFYIGCLCVIPDYENRGIGQKAIRFIENQFPNVMVWTLRTPADKQRNICFYQKVGYGIIDECMKGSVKLVVLNKKIEHI
jgi:ribosomal protein S18 acetylase RimI-like enzyme